MNDFGDFVLTGAKFEIPTFKGGVSAIGVRNGRVVWLGDQAAVPVELRREDLAGGVVRPGYIDCHLHLVWYGTQRLRQVDLTGSATLSEAMDRLREGVARRAAGRSGTAPVIGYGLNDELVAERRLVSRAELDGLSSARPILVQRICGHIAVGNSAAIGLLDEAGRRAGDEVTGRYEESAAMRLLTAVGGAGPGAGGVFDMELAEEAILEGCRVLLSQGITAVGTMLDTIEEFAAYERLHARGQLPIRVSVMPPMRNLESVSARGIKQGTGDEWLRWGPMKMFADGTLGARTALMSFDYADAEGQRGTAVMRREEMLARAAEAAKRGFGVVIHAIGDLALDHALDAVEAAHAAGGAGLLHRIEHVAVARDEQIARMAELGVMAGVQPQFVTSDPWTPERLGKNATWAYRFGDLVSAGVPMGLSSDAPIERIDSGACLRAAIEGHAWRDARQNLANDVAQTAYTTGSARLIGMTDVCGDIAIGRTADFVWHGESGGQRVWVGGREVSL